VKIFHYISAKNEKEKEMERSVYCYLSELFFSTIYASNTRKQNGIQFLGLSKNKCNHKFCVYDETFA